MIKRVSKIRKETNGKKGKKKRNGFKKKKLYEILLENDMFHHQNF